ncbi:hypothetical protein ACH4PU_32575 [Streptomyces sp. NPDC021100]|uniref:hypothetical protein n=1 Tax=Streptomyces sp. NPDC021100 TaxID=3365114 RepID=UPI0037955F94
MCRCTGLRHPKSDACLLYADRWSSGAAAKLPLGYAFSALRLGLQAAEALRDWSAEFCVGPIIAHHQVAYVIVQTASAGQPWPASVTFLGRGRWVTVPAPQCTRRGARGLRWLRSPREAGPTRYTAAVVLLQVLHVYAGGDQQPQPP